MMNAKFSIPCVIKFVRYNPVNYNNSEKFIHNSTFELNPNTIVNIFWIELFLIYWYFCLITTKKKNRQVQCTYSTVVFLP